MKSKELEITLLKLVELVVQGAEKIETAKIDEHEIQCIVDRKLTQLLEKKIKKIETDLEYYVDSEVESLKDKLENKIDDNENEIEKIQNEINEIQDVTQEHENKLDKQEDKINELLENGNEKIINTLINALTSYRGY